MGLCISAGVKTEMVANIIAPLVLVLLMLFGGFYLNRYAL